MEKSRSLFQQVIGHKMLFVVLLLFPTDILAENVTTTTVTTHVDTKASTNTITSPFPAHSNTTAETSMASLPATPATTSSGLSTSGQPSLSFKAAPPVSKQELQSVTAVNPAVPEGTSSSTPSGATTPATTSSGLSTSGQPSLPFKAAPPVSKQELQSVTAVKPAVPEGTSSSTPSEDTVATEEKHPRTEATEVQESKPPPVQKEVPSKMTVTPHFDSETVSSPTKDLGTRSQELSSSAIAYPEATKSTEPKEDKKGPVPPGQAVPELTQTPEIGSHYKSGHFITSVTCTSDTPKFFDKSSSEKKPTVIILAVAFTILLLAGLLVFLYFRRRRHSGSTSFNSPEWAGQATLPDDTGLDKDVEQQAGSVGEGETRRGTLVTFFGKRQSRVPSIAMEDVNGKGSKEETEQLLCGEAGIGSPSEAIGDANGKVPEPLKGSSQKSPASNK